ncbi:hypothetical protein OPKNFCMD_5546 [Methylobacterium crusticola]|uniref:O-antigen ligase domain-containing protein n=1 Tax=Methylobacterium crusticola TaxID=1697972 RepID=A0ABQ4R6J5_9HYPH|nr:hypothetical protein [Methylobacterium crusticola]GJD52779.1 hypothetical protein OPKNFCMD_5546 [Methylobacterium crusticola]
MTVELIGILSALTGILCLVLGRSFAIYAFLCSTLLGSAAATVLTALGSANILPAHLLLGFLTLVALRRPHAARALRGLAYPGPGLLFLVTVIYGVLSAFFLPRLFQNASYVFSIGRTTVGSVILMTPLAPGNGNITQTVYFVGDLVCFCIFFGFSSDRGGRRCIADAVIACGFLNIGFAILDYVTFATGTASLLGFMRNSTYNMLDATEMAGIKRVVGSFTEASSFGAVTLSLLAFNFNLWLSRYRSRLTGPLSLLLLAALLVSTSTTAYVGIAIYFGLIYCGNAVRLVLGAIQLRRAAFIGIAPLIVATALLAIAHSDATASYFAAVLDQIVFAKGVSASAVERSSWNSQALVNFFDSYGLGIGVGSTRASSFMIATLASIGVVGAALYWSFIALAVSAPWSEPDPEGRAIRLAAGSACLAVVIAGCIAGTTIDLGLGFYVLAAVAAAPATDGRPARADVRPAAEPILAGVPA